MTGLNHTIAAFQEYAETFRKSRVGIVRQSWGAWHVECWVLGRVEYTFSCPSLQVALNRKKGWEWGVRL